MFWAGAKAIIVNSAEKKINYCPMATPPSSVSIFPDELTVKKLKPKQSFMKLSKNSYTF